MCFLHGRGAFFPRNIKNNDLLQTGVDDVLGQGRSEQPSLFKMIKMHKSWARVRFLESSLGTSGGKGVESRAQDELWRLQILRVDMENVLPA